eukprot:TRINITY_DN11991_c0_g1_i4.p1 TRINITY_DN11991_c0_g1~~TRINITY_DN11991_c0_g1_i4.p1  ORF type:complete len:244 (+),score=20.75 TRINITY_DN11991_c0_g1_i4:83-814(+)
MYIDRSHFAKFIVEGQEHYVAHEDLRKTSAFFRRNEERLLNQESAVTIQMPPYVTYPSFTLFQDYIAEKGRFSFDEGHYLVRDDQNLIHSLWLSDILEMEDFQTKLITNYILPKKKDRIQTLLYFREVLKKTKSCEDYPMVWENLLEHCIQLCADYLDELIPTSPASDKILNLFMDVPETSLNEIFERYFRRKEKVPRGGVERRVIKEWKEKRGCTNSLLMLQRYRLFLLQSTRNGFNFLSYC